MDNIIEKFGNDEGTRKFVAKTVDGSDVYLDTKGTHVATHLNDTPELFALIQEAISRLDVSGISPGNGLNVETDMGRIIGRTDLAQLKEGDDVFYAKRPNRGKYTKFVRGREAEPTNFVTMRINKGQDGICEVYTAFIGRIAPSFPGGKEDKNTQGREFWQKHALVVGTQEFLPDTVTTECPW